MITQGNKITFNDWRGQIEEKIKNCPSDKYWHIVFDPCLEPDGPEIIKSIDTRLDIWPLFLNTYNESLDYGPQFARLEASSPFVDWVLGRMEYIPFGILFFSEAAQEDALYEHLQNFLECQTLNDQPVLFRYYDPRLFYGFTTYQSAAPGEMLLGPALKIKAWEPGRSIPMELSQKSDQGMRCQPEQVILSDEFTDHLWQESQIHTVIGGISYDYDDEYAQHMKSMPLPKAYEFVDIIRKKLQFCPLTNYNLFLATIITLKHDLNIWPTNEAGTTPSLGEDAEDMKRMLTAMLNW